MIPVKLVIKGLYSYQNEVEIDFNNLTEAGLFGIFGAVGSGKSTLLEAISFSLYGDTERVGSREDRAYNMMNLKSKELKIEFEFRVGAEDNHYLFTVQAKRNKKQFDDVGSFERNAYKKQGSEWIPIEPSAVEVLGLSYENFKRTIIIPQGKFQEFLQLNAGERVTMMRELFGLQRFDLAGKTKALENRVSGEIQHLQGSLDQLVPFDQLVLDTNSAEISELKKGLRILQQNLTTRKKAFDKEEKIRNLVLEKNKITEEYGLLSDRKPAIEEKKNNLELIEICRNNFQDKINHQQSIDKELRSKISELSELLSKISDIDEQINLQQAILNEWQTTYDNRVALDKEISELQSFIEIRAKRKNIEALKSRLENGKQLAKDEEEKKKILQEEKKSITETIEGLEQQELDLDLLYKAKSWIEKRSGLHTELEKSKQNLIDKNQELGQVENNITTQFQSLSENIDFEAFPTDYQTCCVVLDNANNQYSAEITRLEASISDFKTNEILATLAEALESDQPCPLCGAHEHPHVFNLDESQSSFTTTKQQIVHIEKQIQSINDLKNRLAPLYVNYQSISKEITSIQRIIQEKESEIKTMYDKPEIGDYAQSDETIIETTIVAQKELQKSLKAQRKTIQEKESFITEIETKLQKFDETTTKINTEIAGETAVINEYIKKISDEQQARWNQLTPEELVSQHARQSDHLKKAIDAYEKAKHEENALSTTKVGLISTKLEKEKNKEALIRSKEQADVLIQEELNKYQLNSIEQVLSILSESIDVNDLKKEIGDFEQSWIITESRLKDLQQQTQGLVFDQEKFTQLEEEINSIERENEQMIATIAVKDDDLIKLRERMTSHQDLTEQLRTLQIKIDNIKTLAGLFRSSGFVNYASTIYLRNIIELANQRFYTMTRQQLRLELSDKNYFNVRDFLNEGKIRSVKTLSGGQTFQAALSLALALADNIQHLTQSKQNFFFLDEGFGALDSDALNVVFSTLKNLRHENRIVGVISHVHELQQQIPVYLSITNDAEKGSHIEESWSC